MRRTWTWTFDLPADELWPVLADTNRFNEAMGLPPYVLEETPQANGTILRRGRGKAAGFQLEWEEKPYEWIAGRHFRTGRPLTHPYPNAGTVRLRASCQIDKPWKTTHWHPRQRS